MTKAAHFGSNRSFGLSRAILLYSDGQTLFATLHETKTSPDGGPPYLDAGEPLTADFLKQVAKGLGRNRWEGDSPRAGARANARPAGLVDPVSSPDHVLRQ
jgi:hypothetical protein